MVQTRVYVRSRLVRMHRGPVASSHYAMPISQYPGTRWSLCMPGHSNLRPVRGPSSWNGSPRMVVLYLSRRRHLHGLPTAPCQVVEPGSCTFSECPRNHPGKRRPPKCTWSSAACSPVRIHFYRIHLDRCTLRRCDSHHTTFQPGYV